MAYDIIPLAICGFIGAFLLVVVPIAASFLAKPKPDEPEDEPDDED